jgi:putative transposase
VVQGDAALLPRIQQLKAAHPFWGYRRLWAHWRFVEQRAVNKKRVLRLMRFPELPNVSGSLLP